MIGWYVHDHGSGHRRRLEAVSQHLDEPVTGMGSGEPAAGVDWLALPSDAGVSGPLDPAVTDPTAGGTLHWAPLGEPGLRGRAEVLSAWVRRSGCRLLVVDVSVEMLLLARLVGLPTVAVRQPGDRTDPAHALGYATAAALLAPWPRVAQPGAGPLDERTAFTGAFSRFDGRARPGRGAGCPAGRCVVLALGRGGHEVRAADVRAAAGAAGPAWHWHVAGELVGGDRVGHDRVLEPGTVADVWPLLGGADVVVGPCGGGLVADVAAAGVPFLALPQPRPFDEQAALGRLLVTAGVATVSTAWPATDRWPSLLVELADGTAPSRAVTARRWRSWNDGDGASRAAAVVQDVADRYRWTRGPVPAAVPVEATPRRPGPGAPVLPGGPRELAG